MTTFSYTGGAFNNLVGNTPGANVSNLVTLLTDLRTFINGANLDATNLANNGVTAAKIEVQQAWQTIALLSSGGSAWAGNSGNLAYYKDSLGTVHFRGDLFTVGAGSVNYPINGTLCTLPAGYRPVVTERLYLGGGSTIFALDLTTAGVLTNASGVVIPFSGPSYSFGLCHFRAEN